MAGPALAGRIRDPSRCRTGGRSFEPPHVVAARSPSESGDDADARGVRDRPVVHVSEIRRDRRVPPPDARTHRTGASGDREASRRWQNAVRILDHADGMGRALGNTRTFRRWPASSAGRLSQDSRFARDVERPYAARRRRCGRCRDCIRAGSGTPGREGKAGAVRAQSGRPEMGPGEGRSARRNQRFHRESGVARWTPVDQRVGRSRLGIQQRRRAAALVLHFSAPGRPGRRAAQAGPRAGARQACRCAPRWTHATTKARIPM